MKRVAGSGVLCMCLQGCFIVTCHSSPFPKKVSARLGFSHQVIRSPSLGGNGLEHTTNNATLPARRSHDRNRQTVTKPSSKHRALARLFH
eukprot:169355-Prymnesium_polylepis.1